MNINALSKDLNKLEAEVRDLEIKHGTPLQEIIKKIEEARIEAIINEVVGDKK